MVISGRYLLLENKYYVILTVHDISKERVLKSSLQHSNEKFLCFFDNVTVGCAICDKDGKLVEVNDTYVRYMGTTSKNEAVNQLNIYTNPCINPEFKEIMKAGVPVSEEVKYDYEKINKYYVRSCHKDVHYFRFIVNYMWNAGGEVENILIIWVENTLIHKALCQNNMFREIITYASSISKIGFCSLNLSKSCLLYTSGILNLEYYDLVLGNDLSVYPSYYEPWGYTPLESVAFHVPTITTDLAGFGLWVNSLKGRYSELKDGVKVIHRSDYNYSEVADVIKDTISEFSGLPENVIKTMRKNAADIAEKALWKHFIKYYYEAYDVALHNAQKRLIMNS